MLSTCYFDAEVRMVSVFSVFIMINISGTHSVGDYPNGVVVLS